MTEWRESVLGDLCERVTVGHVGKMATEYVPDGVPFLRSQNVRPFVIDKRGLLYIGDDFNAKLRKSSLSAGDVVIVRTGYPGTAAVVPDELDGSNCADLVVITPSDALNPHVLAALFNSVYGQRAVNSQLVGSAQQHFNVGSAKAMRVRLPDRVGQDHIAGVLNSINDLIDNNRRRVEVLEEMARTIYREWFVKFRYPGHEDVPLVDAALGPIPENWQVVTVADVCSRIQAGSTPKRSEAIFWEDAEVDWYKTGDLTDSILIHSSEQISRPALSKGRVFEPETILMAIYGSPTVGRLGLVGTTSSANQAALGLVADPATVTTEYLWFVLEGLRGHLNAIAQGAAQQNVSKEKVATAQILLPPLSLVSDFTATARNPWRLAHVLERESEGLRALRDLLLPKLVTGQIDVSSLDLDSLRNRVA